MSGFGDIGLWCRRVSLRALCALMMRFLVFQSCQDLLDSNSSAFRFPVFKEISVFMLLEGYVSIRNSTVN